MSAGASEVLIESTLSTEAAALAKEAIDRWGDVTYLSAFVNKNEAALLLRATKNGESRLLGVVGSMNFGYDGTGPRCTAEVLAYTNGFGKLEDIERKLFARTSDSVLLLNAINQ